MWSNLEGPSYIRLNEPDMTVQLSGQTRLVMGTGQRLTFLRNRSTIYFKRDWH